MGHIRRWKGQAVAVAAFAPLEPALRERAHLAFVGESTEADADDVAELEAVIRDRGLEGRVLLPRPPLLAASDVVLHASVVPEPGGIATLEALALGRPVIGAR